jgi:GNAT superfamily N-acetyltransferase
MTLVVRPAQPADVATLIALSRRTISASYRRFLGDEAVDDFIESGAADAYVSEHEANCWVIVAQGSVAGFGVCVDATIDLMMIDESLHRRGLGSELLAWFETMLFREHGELRLESFAENRVANLFYSSRGWIETDRYIDTETCVQRIVFTKTPKTS